LVPLTAAEPSLSTSPKPDGERPGGWEFKYTLTATNVCGGSDTKTVAVRVKGSIDPVPAVLLKSVFYPTDYPDRHNPALGLLSSQREALTTLASGFVKYLEYDPGAKLSLVAHTDPRGGPEYNSSLSLRRAELTKQFLVSQEFLRRRSRRAPKELETFWMNRLLHSSKPRARTHSLQIARSEVVHFVLLISAGWILC